MIDLMVKLYTMAGAIYRKMPGLWGIVAVVFVFIDYFDELWESLFTRIDGMIAGAAPGAISFAPLGLVNYVFPLDTLLTTVVTYAAIRLTCAGIRIVKSFVPTIA